MAATVGVLRPAAPLSPVVGTGWGEGVRLERQVYLMGTLATLMTYDGDREAGVRRLEDMVRILEETEAELSTWRDDSLLAQLNRQPVGAPWNAPPSLCTLLGEIEFWHRETERTFDAAVGRLIEAWGLRTGGRRPSAEEVQQARARTGSEHLVLDTATCSVTRRRDAIIDEGGFGKGEALDRVARALGGKRDRESFVGRRDAAPDERKKTPDPFFRSAPWLIDLGGQVMVHGQPLEASAWRVGLAHPTERHERLLEIDMTSGSLSTSGGSERDLYLDGIRAGHILDPRTGRPASFGGSVVVWHQRGLIADVLSTALFVMGPEEGLMWAEARDLAACFLIPQRAGGPRHEVELRATAAFRRLFPSLLEHVGGLDNPVM